MLDLLYGPTHIHTWLLEELYLWLYRHLSVKWLVCFLICCLGLSYLFLQDQASFNFMATVTICSDFGAQENKVCHCFHCFLIYLPWSDGTRCHDLCFLKLSFKPAFSLSSFTFKRRFFSYSLLSAIRVVSSAYLRLFSWQPWFQLALHQTWHFTWCTLDIS